MNAATHLERLLSTFEKWLHLPDLSAVLLTLATIAANRLPGDPVWLMLIGPPGSGKTELLVPLTALRYVWMVATLTEAALLSGTSQKEKTSDATGGLLKELGRFGIILCKDFTSVLSMHRDARGAVLAALREVFDGSWTRRLGVDGGRTLSWQGKVGLLAGCTDAIDTHHAVIASMGERFVFFRMPPTDARAQARRALDHTGNEEEMRAELAHAVSTFFGTIRLARRFPELGRTVKDRLIDLSELAVRCRSAVERDPYFREIVLIPEPEAPTRLAGVLSRLFVGLEAIGVEPPQAWPLVRSVALDSMPMVRRVVFDVLARESEWMLETKQVAERSQYPNQTIRRALEELEAHGIVERERPEKPGRDVWALSTWATRRYEAIMAPFPEMSADDAEEPAPTGAKGHSRNVVSLSQ
jgi:DNA-binding HxlR family transcriptional regulator